MASRPLTPAEANRALRRLPDLAQVETQRVMDATALAVMQGAVQRAPEGDTRLLKSSISWARRKLSAVVGVFADAFYWKFLEYGTVKMQSRPFLRPAAVAQEAEHERQMLQALDRANTRMEREA